MRTPDALAVTSEGPRGPNATPRTSAGLGNEPIGLPVATIHSRAVPPLATSCDSTGASFLAPSSVRSAV